MRGEDCGGGGREGGDVGGDGEGEGEGGGGDEGREEGEEEVRGKEEHLELRGVYCGRRCLDGVDSTLVKLNWIGLNSAGV